MLKLKNKVNFMLYTYTVYLDPLPGFEPGP